MLNMTWHYDKNMYTPAKKTTPKLRRYTASVKNIEVYLCIQLCKEEKKDKKKTLRKLYTNLFMSSLLSFKTIQSGICAFSVCTSFYKIFFFHKFVQGCNLSLLRNWCGLCTAL